MQKYIKMAKEPNKNHRAHKLGFPTKKYKKYYTLSIKLNDELTSPIQGF